MREYAQALRPNVCPVRIHVYFRHDIPFMVFIFPVWNGNIYFTPVAPLDIWSTKLGLISQTRAGLIDSLSY